MNTTADRRPVIVVSTCMRPNGFPEFALNTVEVTSEEHENGVHYSLAEERLSSEGFEEPFVHFCESEAPPFLVPAVRAYLADGMDADVPIYSKPKEEAACSAQ